MVKYCAVAVCKNGSHNKPNLSYFRFPSDQKLRKKWETFCRRADEKFKTLADPRVCSQHFSREYFKRTLSWKIEVISSGVPTILDPKQPAAKSDPREQRKNERDRRAQHLADNSTELPAKRKRETCRKVKSVECIHQQGTPVWSATTITRTDSKTWKSNTETCSMPDGTYNGRPRQNGKGSKSVFDFNPSLQPRS